MKYFILELAFEINLDSAAFCHKNILGNAVTSQHGALLSDDIKALKTNR